MKKVDHMNPNPQPSQAQVCPAGNTIRRRRFTPSHARAGVAAVAGGLIALAALAACGTSARTPARGTAASRTPVTATGQYSYYRSMMRGHFGGMMSGGPRWMMSPAGYRWMTGGTVAPGWLRGRALPGFMMGAGTDPGKIMGRLWAGAPGPRVSSAQAARLSTQIPAGAKVHRTARVITFTTTRVHVVVVASPPGGPDQAYRIAGLVNPRLVIPAGARVSIEAINADPTMAHGLVITSALDTRSWMPMMTARPAFPGSALWFLGDQTIAGMHAGTLAFTAPTPGTYRYLCPIPGHARDGMTGLLTITR